MSEPIAFPKNYDYYAQQGKKAMDASEWALAISMLQMAYAINQTFVVNISLVQSYLEIGEHQEAQRLAQEMTHNYLREFSYAQVYFQVLICNQQFMQTYEWLRKISAHFSEKELEIKELHQQLEQAENVYQQFETKKIQQLKKQIETLQNHSKTQQLMIAKTMRRLPKSDFIEVSQKILQNKEIHWLVRSWFLEELAAVSVSESIVFLNPMNETKQFIPAFVRRPLESLAYQQVIRYLEEECYNNDPSLFEVIIEEVRLHCTLLYPFIDETIQQPALWAKAYLLKYTPLNAENQVDSLIELDEIQQKQEWLQQQMITLFS